MVERVPNMDRPARKYDRYSVPGRNGDIFVMQDAWENVEQTYDIWWEDSISATVAEGGYTLSEWLFGPTGYQTLTDDFDPDHYRKAVFLGPYDVENTMQKLGRARITFDCDPRRFLNSGLTWVNVPNNTDTAITNPTPFPAKPVLDVDNNYICNITNLHADGEQENMTIAKAGHFIVDCSKESIVDGNGDPAFDSTWGTFPTFSPGVNTIRFGSVSGTYKVQPNWWTL